MNTTQKFSATKPIITTPPTVALSIEGITLTGAQVTRLHDIIARAAKGKTMEVVLKADDDTKWRFSYRAKEPLQARARFSLMGSIAHVFGVEVVNDKNDYAPLNKGQSLPYKPQLH